jgi:hypothetical protein
VSIYIPKLSVPLFIEHSLRCNKLSVCCKQNRSSYNNINKSQNDNSEMTSQRNSIKSNRSDSHFKLVSRKRTDASLLLVKNGRYTFATCLNHDLFRNISKRIVVTHGPCHNHFGCHPLKHPYVSDLQVKEK